MAEGAIPGAACQPLQLHRTCCRAKRHQPKGWRGPLEALGASEGGKGLDGGPLTICERILTNDAGTDVVRGVTTEPMYLAFAGTRGKLGATVFHGPLLAFA